MFYLEPGVLLLLQPLWPEVSGGGQRGKQKRLSWNISFLRLFCFCLLLKIWKVLSKRSPWGDCGPRSDFLNLV